MPKTFTPAGSARAYQIPDRTTDPVEVEPWFEDALTSVDSHLDDVDDVLAAKLANAPAKNTQTADFDFALTDAAGLLVVANKATALAGTLKQNSAMASSWPTDSIIRFINRNDGVLTITAGSGVTIIGTALTFAKGKGGALVWVAANTWVCVPFSGGADAAVISGTTGSPASSSISGWAQLKFTGNGSFTISTAGLVMLEISGGGGGGSSSRAGGAGGQIRRLVWLEPGTYTVVVGAGGSTSSRGGISRVGSLVALGGGNLNDTAGPVGSSSAGYTAAATDDQGYNGAAASPGGGGGAGGAATGSTPTGIGGVGVAWLDGNTYGVGGSEASASAGAANTGNGGGGSNAAGGSGLVTVSTPI